MEVRLEVERVLRGKRPPLPVEPLVHSEERDVLEREPSVVDHGGEQWILRFRSERQDERELLVCTRSRIDLSEHRIGEMAIDVVPGRQDREREARARDQIVGWDAQPFGEELGLEHRLHGRRLSHDRRRPRNGTVTVAR